MKKMSYLFVMLFLSFVFTFSSSGMKVSALENEVVEESTSEIVEETDGLNIYGFVSSAVDELPFEFDVLVPILTIVVFSGVLLFVVSPFLLLYALI